MIHDFISLFYPQNCINCQKSLISVEKYICTTCKLSLPVTNDHLYLTNDLFKKFAFDPTVKSATAFLFFQKQGIAQKLLHNLKYNGKKEIAEIIGNWYGKILASHLEVDMIVPVPLHKSRERKRGYNQSQYFAQGLSNQLQVPVQSELVKRLKNRITQTKKAKIERWLNVQNVYSDIPVTLEGKRVLVVDDMITTGATVGMLCDKLHPAGVQSIHVAAIARGK